MVTWAQPGPLPWDGAPRQLYHRFEHTGFSKGRHVYRSRCGNFVLHLKHELRAHDPRFGCTCRECAKDG